MMKTLLALAARATAVLAGSPVTAQEGGGPSPQALAQHRALVRALPQHQAAMRRSPNAVFDGQQYLGADPDPFIRNDMTRDQGRD